MERADARASGRVRYFTGKPCKHGHIAERLVSDRACLGCAYYKCRRADQREKHRLRQREFYKTEKAKEYYRRRYEIADKKALTERERERYKCPDVRGRIRARKNAAARTPNGIAAAFTRQSLARVLDRGSKDAEQILGYSRDDLISRIEETMADGMSWDNYGEWHIDHIVPVQWFLRHGERDAKAINCLTNLRALWAKENISKGAHERWVCEKTSEIAVAEAIRRSTK